MSHNKHASPLKSTVHIDGRDGLYEPMSNAANMNRKKCLGEHEQADRMAFDNRVQEIMNTKYTGNTLNARVIETWINDTLSDAENLDIPGVILKPTHKLPLQRYFADRLYLVDKNVKPEMVDRIYRGLFVYSIGFYEMVNKTLANAKTKYTLMASIWKVFSILLEYCCKSNYQMLIAKIGTEHQKTLEELQGAFDSEIAQAAQNERDLKN